MLTSARKESKLVPCERRCRAGKHLFLPEEVEVSEEAAVTVVAMETTTGVETELVVGVTAIEIPREVEAVMVITKATEVEAAADTTTILEATGEAVVSATPAAPTTTTTTKAAIIITATASAILMIFRTKKKTPRTLKRRKIRRRKRRRAATTALEVSMKTHSEKVLSKLRPLKDSKMEVGMRSETQQTFSNNSPSSSNNNSNNSNNPQLTTSLEWQRPTPNRQCPSSSSNNSSSRIFL